MPGGACVRSVMTVAPVVVMPDIASKKASSVLSCNIESLKGSAAKMVSAIQPKTVMMKTCFVERDIVGVRLLIAMAPPKNPVIAIDVAKTCQSLSW